MGSKNKKETAGKVQMTRDGHIFVKTPETGEEIYVRANKTLGALNGDTVRVRFRPERKWNNNPEGEVIEILERSRKPFVGVLHLSNNGAWVIMQSKVMPYDISVDMTDENGCPCRRTSKKNALSVSETRIIRKNKGEYSVTGLQGASGEIPVESGIKVAVIVDRWERRETSPHGIITDVLGKAGENDTEMHAILTEYGLPYRFEPEVEKEAGAISEKITARDLKGRNDYRDVMTFTIDPEDAKDFDDAISFRKLENGNYEVGVHIADVSHYVTPGSAIDEEARSRGTSVYLVDRTVPMLPEKLCNRLCSLRPNEDKLTFSTIFEITPSAEIKTSGICRTIINSDYRFAYSTAQQIIDNGEKSLDMPLEGGTDGKSASFSDESILGQGAVTGTVIPRPLKEAVLILWNLAEQLKIKRFKAGAINFERPQMKVKVDEKGRPVDVFQVVSAEANSLIEEFMLLANRTVAEFVATNGKMNGKTSKKAKTFVYRVHDEPNMDKLMGLKHFAGIFGYKTSFGDKKVRSISSELNRLLDKAKGNPERGPMEMLALRSMAKACYSVDNIGHYGLAFKFYTHFTSPIRRYPDTMVHRLLSLYLNGEKSQDREFYSKQCTHASERELIAANAERDSIKYKLVEFMQDKIGHSFNGIISGLTEWGMYVEIEPTKIEGMVPLRDIKNDFYEFDEENYCIKGKRTGIVYRFGDSVKIKVKSANLEQRLLDYELEIEDSPESSSNKGKKKRQCNHRPCKKDKKTKRK